ncbi:hypothetical protein AD948_11940 [Acetobacter senegalensis]|uniref:Uncharacterized protein n=1 Tax=Acetobacter senegalensis TaxID=446692 RepID=A0A149TZ11_9PROT|nr:hypothetical protein AD948_11940 [Acetobacter senegalensis]
MEKSVPGWRHLAFLGQRKLVVHGSRTGYQKKRAEWGLDKARRGLRGLFTIRMIGGCVGGQSSMQSLQPRL